MRSFAIEEPGSPVPALYATLPTTRPHWAKEMPSRIGTTPIVEYLRKAYADDLAKVKNRSPKMSSLEKRTRH